jgi:DNA-directed RNA polymerase subunit RPC12/RpoP
MLGNNIAVYVCLECDKEFEIGGHLKKQFEDHRSVQIDDDQDNTPDYDEENW